MTDNKQSYTINQVIYASFSCSKCGRDWDHCLCAIQEMFTQQSTESPSTSHE